MNPTAAVLHDAALNVIARLLVQHEGRDPVQARALADELLLDALADWVRCDAELHRIAQDICREFGFTNDSEQAPPS
jgi:hypothetical protein